MKRCRQPYPPPAWLPWRQKPIYKVFGEREYPIMVLYVVLALTETFIAQHVLFVLASRVGVARRVSTVLTVLSTGACRRGLSQPIR